MIHWILFLVFVFILLAFDLGVFHRKDQVFNFKESVFWSVVWVTISCMFGGFMWYEYGPELGSQWFTAYVLEKSLSVDNLFVISLIFTFLATPAQYQHRCLFYGILGAIVLRGIFIIFGVAVVSKFAWILYLFGLFLIYSGFKIIFSDEDEIKVEENKVVKYFKKHFKIYPNYDGHNFFIKSGKHYIPTLMFIVLLMIETTDIVFAVDSIPAALGVSNNSFILYSSNIMAVLGLRALYFVLLSIIDKFWMLKYGIGLVLCFIGIKMLFEHFVEISSVVSLCVTLTILLSSICLSLLFKNKKTSTVISED
ncbi:MAG TPA: TerC/Alx family metal homeostasis membrane protein [Bacteroidales bacterium]